MSLFRRGIHVASKQIVYLAIILSVLIVMVAGSLYWLSDAVEQRQNEIAQWVSEQIDYPVTIGKANIRWLGLVPKLHVEHVELRSKQDQSLICSLKSLYLGLDIISSIQQGEPVLNDVTLRGVGVAIDKALDGKLSIRGLNITTESPLDNTEWFNWLKMLNRFHLQSISVAYTDRTNPLLSGKYQLTDAVVNHKIEQWSMIGNLQLPTDLGQQLQFQVSAQANEADLQASSWQWKMTTTNLVLAPFAQQFIWQDINIQQGMADINLSAIGRGTELGSITSTLKLTQLGLQSIKKQASSKIVIIDELSGDFDWRRQANLWQLSGHKMIVNMGDERWPETDLTIRKENDSWLIASNYLRLSDLTSLALLSQYSPDIVRKMQPAGDIERLNLRYSSSKGLTGLAFNLKEVGLLPWKDYPGVTGLTGVISWDSGLANITIDSHQLSLYADKWLKKAVFFDSVTGHVRFQQDKDTWALQSHDFSVWNDDLTLQLDGSITQEASGKIDNNVIVKLENIAVNKWQDYVPQHILNDDFKKWANTAFVNGKIIKGNIELSGDLAHFPFDKSNNEEYFKMALNVDGVQLHYASGWPDLYGVHGTITGTGNDLIIKSKQGEIAGFKFDNVTTTIDKLVESNPILTTTGQLSGTTEQAVKFLRISPLKHRFSSAVEGIKAQGNSDIQLDLMVPLTDVNTSTASGHVSFKNSQLDYVDLAGVSLKQINGELNFSGSGVDANNIKAKLLDETVKINVKPQHDNTVISMLGNISSQKLREIWPEDIPAFVSGKTAYQFDVTVLEKALGDFYVNYNLTSDLNGIGISLPQPFTKEPQQLRAFNIAMHTVNNKPNYSFNYADTVHLLAEPNGKTWRVGVRFGAGTAKLPKTSIQIRGQLARLSIDEWLAWNKKQTNTDNRSLSTSIDDVSMTIDDLTGFNQQLTALNFSANKDAQGWRINLHSDQAKGSIYWPNNFQGPAVLDVNLDKLILDFTDQKNETEEKEEKMPLWPAMKIAINSLTVNDMALGQLQAYAARNNNVWSVKSATLHSDSYDAAITQGEWQQTEQNDHSSLKFNMEINDLAKLSSELGYQQAMDAKDVELNGGIKWPNNPLNFSVATIKGKLAFKVGKGKLNDVEPGAAGRIFGLMSIATLPRRLALDFSDLFSKGFNFDSIKGSFRMVRGKATTDDFILKGPSADIKMSGPIDLVNQQYDQIVKITPNVSSTLPLAGAVAGGPIGLAAGAAILLADKLVDSLFGKNMVNIISYKYALTGSWDNPQFNVFQSTQK